MRDGFRINGRVTCYKLDPSFGSRVIVGAELEEALKDGGIEELWSKHNLIVDQGLQAIAKFLGNNLNAPTVGGATFSTLSDITIGSMEIGDTGSPAAPATGDTTSVGSLVYVPPITVSYPDEFSVQFNGVIPVTEAVGLTLTEESLKLVNGLVAAKCIFSQLKTNAYGLQFSHKIAFSRS